MRKKLNGSSYIIDINITEQISFVWVKKTKLFWLLTCGCAFNRERAREKEEVVDKKKPHFSLCILQSHYIAETINSIANYEAHILTYIDNLHRQKFFSTVYRTFKCVPILHWTLYTARNITSLYACFMSSFFLNVNHIRRLNVIQKKL